jgi:hypothetical protein
MNKKRNKLGIILTFITVCIFIYGNISSGTLGINNNKNQIIDKKQKIHKSIQDHIIWCITTTDTNTHEGHEGYLQFTSLLNNNAQSEFCGRLNLLIVIVNIQKHYNNYINNILLYTELDSNDLNNKLKEIKHTLKQEYSYDAMCSKQDSWEPKEWNGAQDKLQAIGKEIFALESQILATANIPKVTNQKQDKTVIMKKINKSIKILDVYWNTTNYSTVYINNNRNKICKILFNIINYLKSGEITTLEDKSKGIKIAQDYINSYYPQDWQTLQTLADKNKLSQIKKQLEDYWNKIKPPEVKKAQTTSWSNTMWHQNPSSYNGFSNANSTILSQPSQVAKQNLTTTSNNGNNKYDQSIVVDGTKTIINPPINTTSNPLTPNIINNNENYYLEMPLQSHEYAKSQPVKRQSSSKTTAINNGNNKYDQSIVVDSAKTIINPLINTTSNPLTQSNIQKNGTHYSKIYKQEDPVQQAQPVKRQSSGKTIKNSNIYTVPVILIGVFTAICPVIYYAGTQRNKTAKKEFQPQDNRKLPYIIMPLNS